MSVLGIGVDIVETVRIERSIEKFADRFLNRVFTPDEVAYCQSMKFPARHFAARFAAKEAVSKAFGTGIGKSMGWKDIEVARHPHGEPFAVLHGGAAKLAAEKGGATALISLSHADHYAVSQAILVLRMNLPQIPKWPAGGSMGE